MRWFSKQYVTLHIPEYLSTLIFVNHCTLFNLMGQSTAEYIKYIFIKQYSISKSHFCLLETYIKVSAKLKFQSYTSYPHDDHDHVVLMRLPRHVLPHQALELYCQVFKNPARGACAQTVFRLAPGGTLWRYNTDVPPNQELVFSKETFCSSKSEL